MALNPNHAFEDLGEVKCAIVEKNCTPERVEFLKNILEHHELIKKPAKDKRGVVGIGAKVKIDVDGQKDEFLLVGTLEANPALGKISNESPVGRALLGHKIGDEVIVNSPVKITYKIKNIKYEIS